MEVKKNLVLKPHIGRYGLSVLFALFIFCNGCGNKFFDPTQIGRFRPTPAVNVILDSLGVAEETPSSFAGAEEPKPSDVVAYETDYVFGAGDVARIAIFELLQQGAAFVNDYVVTETGKISIPEVGVVEAAGMTESQLEEEIRQILSPSILKTPSVTVTLLNSERRTFTISGEGVPRPSRYTIPRYDFRLLDALATAGGISQFNISYIYVSRAVTGKEAINETLPQQELEKSENNEQNKLKAEPQKQSDPQHEMMEIISPHARNKNTDVIITSAEMATENELAEAALPEGFEQSVQKQIISGSNNSRTLADPDQKLIEKSSDSNQPESRIEWIFQDGKWVPVQTGQPVQKKQTEKIEKPKEFIPEKAGWEQIGTGGVQARVIKIPADKLAGGDPRYNIIIKPGDIIQVPVDIIGEFCIMGNVNSQGYINLTGRPMNLKMAIAAAGGLGPLAWPKQCEVVRRISKDKEEIVLVNLDKIASGEQPDFFIKPNDLINVGTHETSRWRAVLRNAFRATYGFGFIYDRNFADPSFGKRSLTFNNVDF